MQYKFFVIPFDDDGSAEEELNHFLRAHRVTQTERHFSSERGCWATNHSLSAYMIFTNEELAQLSKLTSLTDDAVKEIPEIPQSRWRDFGSFTTLFQVKGYGGYFITFPFFTSATFPSLKCMVPL